MAILQMLFHCNDKSNLQEMTLKLSYSMEYGYNTKDIT